MSNRTAESYSEVFNFIEKNIFNLNPLEMMTDFEAGMRNAIRKCYPGAALRGCWFHYSDAIRKRFLKLGLHSILKSSSDARLIKYQLMSLPLLPAQNFEEGYLHVKNTAIEYNLTEDLKPIFLYYENYWLDQVHKILIFISNIHRNLLL